MPVKIQSVPYGQALARLVSQAEQDLRIASPFITAGGARFILQAHVGAFTNDGKQEMVEITLTNLLNHFADEPLLTPVG